MTDQGLYISDTVPNVKPSYQNFTFSFSISGIPCSSIAAKTSSSVKPKDVAYSSDVVVTTFRLFRSEKIDSLLTLVIPVMIPRSRDGLVLNVLLKSARVYATSSSQKPFTYASCIGVSYSSKMTIHFFP